MYFIKNFLSHFLAIIIFISSLYLTGVLMSREIITHHNIYNALEKSEILEEAMKSNNKLKDVNIPEELLDYVEIEDIIYNYITDKFLYEAKIIDDEPTIDRKELNKRLATGIELYIDEKIDEYTGGLNSFLESAGIDLGIKDKVNDYIENNTSIDLSNDEYITEEDLNSIYEYVEEAILEIKESTYAFDVINVIYDDNYLFISITALILSFILIGLINFNIISSFLYSIAPCIINAIFYLIIYLVSYNLEFDGSLTAKVINYLKGKVGQIAFKYFIIFILLTIAILVIYYIIKNLNIFISHKKGITTLDTVFDDYDQDIDEESKEQKEEK